MRNMKSLTALVAVSALVLCTAAATAMSLAAPWVLKHAVDDLTQGVTPANG